MKVKKAKWLGFLFLGAMSVAEASLADDRQWGCDKYYDVPRDMVIVEIDWHQPCSDEHPHPPRYYYEKPEEGKVICMETYLPEGWTSLSSEMFYSQKCRRAPGFPVLPDTTILRKKD